MNPIFSRTLKSLCTVAVAALLSACGASSTVDPFTPTRVIAFGDGFNHVDANGSALSTVRTSTGGIYVTDDSIAGAIAAQYRLTVKNVAAPTTDVLAAQGGFSYATANARVGTLTDGSTSDLADQIDNFLTANARVAKNDLIVIAVGNWDIYDAVTTNGLDAATTQLTASIKRLTLAGAEHVLVVPAINVGRTPWGSANPTSTALSSDFYSDSLSKLDAEFGLIDRPKIFFAQVLGSFNNFAGQGIQNLSGITLTNQYQPACGSGTTGCDAANITTSYTSYVFADEINLTPVMNKYLANLIVGQMRTYAWIR
jgi:outer membrane lipase/esterase